jgi:septal ring factor EnvC (AmiA/AmiB activator)
MGFSLKIIQLFLFCFSLILQISSAVDAANDQNSRRQATEEELTKLQQKINQLQSRQAQNRSTLSKEQKDLKDTDVLINKSRLSLELARNKLRNSQTRLTLLKAQRNKLEEQKKAQQKALKNQIKAAHAGGKQEYLKLLFNQEDPSKVSRTLVYYDYLNKARIEKIHELTTTLEKLAEVEIEIKEEQKRLINLEAVLADENDRLATLKSERQTAIKKLSASLIDNSRQLLEWRANEQDLISLLEALKETVATIIPEESLDGLSNLKGKLNWPIKGRIRESFGSARGDGQMRWSGVLIGADEGQKVSAIHHGRIVYSDYLRGFGLIIIIYHGDGYMSLYGHNEALFKQPGDWVEAGEQIATVAQTCGYPSTVLYFEIRLRSKALNPVIFIVRN